MNRFFLATVLLMLSLSRDAGAQSAAILKDSVAIGPDYYVLEELRLDVKDAGSAEKIYKKIRSGSEVMKSAISLSPEQRLRAKKDTLLTVVADNTLREAGYGFEHYEVFYEKQGLLNLSVKVQSYGSPFESRQHYCFDLSTGKEIGAALFSNHNALLKAISEKLRTQEVRVKAKAEDLGEFALQAEHSGPIDGIRFFIEDTANYRNSGYETYEVYFTRKEITLFIAAAYRKRLINR